MCSFLPLAEMTAVQQAFPSGYVSRFCSQALVLYGNEFALNSQFTKFVIPVFDTTVPMDTCAFM